MNSFRKQWIGLSLLMLMLVKAWVIPLVCLDYEVRKEYITKAFCINKNRPQLNCNGKCYLAKKLAEAEKQQQRQAEQDFVSNMLSQVLVTDHTIRFDFQAALFLENQFASYQYKSPFLGRQIVGNIFHPPLA